MLLFICHANICRSPMAERLARLALTAPPTWPGTGARTDAITVASAGTHARTGDAMHPGAAHVLAELGADNTDFSSRLVSADLLARASLVLTATREQRAFCVRLAPVALRRTFTIRQFGRLTAAVEAPGSGASGPGDLTAGAAAGGGSVSAVAALLDQILAVRGSLQPVPPDEDDLADPVNGTAADVLACARQIQLSLRPALAIIGAG